MCRYLSASILILLACALGLGCEPPGAYEVVFGEVDDMPDSLSFAVVEGSNPPTQRLQITNAGTCDLSYSITPSTTETWSWLTVSPTTGSVAASGSGTVTVGADVVSTVLTPGGYTGTLGISATCTDTGNPAVGSPLNVSVNLTVTANNAILGVSDDDLEFDVPSITSGSWTTLGTTNAPSDRRGHMSAWSGYEFFVAGGETLGTSSNTSLSSAAAYNPSTDTWRAIAPLPTVAGWGVGRWVDGQFVVIGASDTNATTLTPGNAMVYSPTTNSWTIASGTGASITARVSVWCAVTDGDLLYFWGGSDGTNRLTTNVGAIYDPASDTTTAMTATGQPDNDSEAFCALTGTELLVLTNDQLGRYALSSGTWTTTSLPGYRTADACAWTGKELVVSDQSTPAIEVWTQSTAQWRTAATYSNLNNTTAFWSLEAIWTGREVIFLGLDNDEQYAAFDPETNVIRALGTDLTSDGRFGGQTHLWTGERLLVFGGTREVSSSSVIAPGGASYQ